MTSIKQRGKKVLWWSTIRVLWSIFCTLLLHNNRCQAVEGEASVRLFQFSAHYSSSSFAMTSMTFSSRSLRGKRLGIGETFGTHPLSLCYVTSHFNLLVFSVFRVLDLVLLPLSCVFLFTQLFPIPLISLCVFIPSVHSVLVSSCCFLCKLKMCRFILMDFCVCGICLWPKVEVCSSVCIIVPVASAFSYFLPAYRDMQIFSISFTFLSADLYSAFISYIFPFELNSSSCCSSQNQIKF